MKYKFRIYFYNNLTNENDYQDVVKTTDFVCEWYYTVIGVDFLDD